MLNKNRDKIMMFIELTELEFILFRMNSKFYYKLHYKMSIKCHDQNFGHSKNHNEIFLIHY